ncbi:MAG: flavin reductase family protein, partial [Bacteroidota bacterium]
MKEQEVSQALRKITYGFYIVTTRKPSQEMTARDKDYIAAGTISWVNQASFEPPLVTVAVQKYTDLHETIEKSRVFAVNIVGKDDQGMLKPFAEKSIIEGDTINGFAFEDGKTGAPILRDVPAYFECKVVEDLSRGDHSVYLGEVVGGETRNADAVPLVEWETHIHYR